MLMAAGLGTRLKPFTDQLPKALMPVMGIPAAQFAIDCLNRAGVRRIVANVHHFAEDCKKTLPSLDLGSSSLKISDESRLLLGSAGGIRHALPLLGDEAFILLNADVLCDIDLRKLWFQHQRMRERDGVTMTLAIMPNTVSSGRKESYREIIYDHTRGLITGLGGLEKNRPFFIGAAVLEPAALQFTPSDIQAEFVPSLLEPAIRDGKAAIHLCEGQWHDIGTPALWMETHFALMSSIETGHLLPEWRRRIEKMNRRLGQTIWVSRDAPRFFSSAQWVAPCYWSPQEDRTALVPESFGPRCVLYGPAPQKTGLKNGAGFRSNWVT